MFRFTATRMHTPRSRSLRFCVALIAVVGVCLQLAPPHLVIKVAL